jgi:murein DD-endopeptidase MepM/ murein hydrolase activator NlpD
VKQLFSIIFFSLLYYFCFTPVSSLAQKLLPDSVEFIQDDTNKGGRMFLPPDVVFIPADYMYNHLWNNDNIRPQYLDLSKKTDTTTLIFDSPNENPFTFPCNCKLISPFGYRGSHLHSGVDLKLNAGDPVYSAFDGKVRLAKYYRGYGNAVVIRHNNGLETVYGHLSKINVALNQQVKSGDVIGAGGRTGRATTNHLHFETRFLFQAFDPEILIDVNNRLLRECSLSITGSTFKTNGLANDNQKPVNPDTNTLKKSVVNTKPAVSTKPVANQKTAGHLYHTVTRGDTLYSLAKKNGTSVEAICNLNHITTGTILKPGRKLRIK